MNQLVSRSHRSSCIQTYRQTHSHTHTSFDGAQNVREDFLIVFDKSSNVCCSNINVLAVTHFHDIFMAAFVLIAFSVGCDLYKIGVRCIESGFSITNIINALKDIHNEIRSEKYLQCIDEIYENLYDNSDIHSTGIECINCRRKRKNRKIMICNEIENAYEVDRCEEAFEILSQVSEMQ